MFSKRMEEAINAQINAEFWSAYLYLSMSTHFAKDGKVGFSNWFKVQYMEENSHAMKFIEYVNSRGGEVKLQPIKEVQHAWDSPLAAFEDALAHERVVTAMIGNLLTIANEEKDYATASMLQWFVNEQVEEEGTAQEYVDNLKLIDGNGFGIYTLDKELRSRVYVAAAE